MILHPFSLVDPRVPAWSSVGALTHPPSLGWCPRPWSWGVTFPQRSEQSIPFPNLQIPRKWLLSVFQTLWDPGVEAKPSRASSFHRWFSALFHRPNQNLSSGYSSSQAFEIWGPHCLWIVQFCPFESRGCVGLARGRWKKPAHCFTKSSYAKSGSHSLQGRPSTFLLIHL